MSDIKKSFKVRINGIISIENTGKIIMSVEDVGDIALDRILGDLDGRKINMLVMYDEDYEQLKVDVDSKTGEVI
jgi:hypothetical protein